MGRVVMVMIIEDLEVNLRSKLEEYLLLSYFIHSFYLVNYLWNVIYD